jgi:hypothetical protein
MMQQQQLPPHLVHAYAAQAAQAQAQAAWVLQQQQAQRFAAAAAHLSPEHQQLMAELLKLTPEGLAKLPPDVQEQVRQFNALLAAR